MFPVIHQPGWVSELVTVRFGNEESSHEAPWFNCGKCMWQGCPRTLVTLFNESACPLISECPSVSPHLSLLSSVGLGPDLPTATQPEWETSNNVIIYFPLAILNQHIIDATWVHNCLCVKIFYTSLVCLHRNWSHWILYLCKLRSIVCKEPISNNSRCTISPIL